MREVCFCSCLPVLPGLAWVVLSKICILFSQSLYISQLRHGVPLFWRWSSVLSLFLSRKTFHHFWIFFESILSLSSHHLSEADLNSEANQLSLEDPVESVGVLASSSRFCITPPVVDVPASTRRFPGIASRDSLMSRLPDGKIGSLPFLGLCKGGGLGGAIQGKEGIKFCSAA